MSEEKTNNLFIGLAGLAIVIAVVGWFSATSNISAENIAVNKVDTEEKIIHTNETKATEKVAEEIVVVADELVEKANEAAIRNEVNQAMKQSEDTDITE